MHKYRIDEWVLYNQFPDANTERLRRGKRAVILDHIGANRYVIYVDDPDLDEKWRIKKVNEAELESTN